MSASASTCSARRSTRRATRSSLYREALPGVRLGEVSGLVDSLPGFAREQYGARRRQGRARRRRRGLRRAPVDPQGRADQRRHGRFGGFGGRRRGGGQRAAAAAVQHRGSAALRAARASASPPIRRPGTMSPPACSAGWRSSPARSRPSSTACRPRSASSRSCSTPRSASRPRSARRLLRPEVPMALAVEHSRRLAAFVAGCATGDLGLLRAGLEDLLVEPQREHLLPALAGGEGGGARRRRARLLLLRVRPFRLRLGARGGSGRGRAGDGRGVPSLRPRSPRLSRAGRFAGGQGRAAAPAGACGNAPVKFVSTRGGSPEVSISEAIRRGAAPDGGLYVPAGEVTFDPAGLDDREALAPLGAALLAPFFEGDPLARCPACHLRGGVRLPRAPGRSRRGRSGISRARAVPRADRRVQGFRRALPDGQLRPARRRRRTG